MKSAYEIAMERMEKESGASQKLTDDQKKEIAEIEKKFEAKIAETKLDIEAKITGLEGAGAFEEVPALKKRLAEELAQFTAKRDEEKEKVWQHKDA